jgi:hypothetical protein
MLTKLAKGVEAFATGGRPAIFYNKILEGPSQREFVSINGIFPKIVSQLFILLNCFSYQKDLL